MNDPKYCTVVFEGDIRQFDGNPFRAGNLFGKCVAISVGNRLDDEEINADMLSELEELLAFIDDEVLLTVPTDRGRKLSDRLLAVIKRAKGEQ